MIWIDASSDHADNSFDHNICQQTLGHALVQYTAQTGITANTNCWYGGSAGALAGSGDVNADPLFVNAGGLTMADYLLQSSSPCIAPGIGAGY